MLKKPPLVIDNTLVNRFGYIGRFDILESLYSGNILVPTEVIKEAVSVTSLEQAIKSATTLGWMEEHTINFQDHPSQVKLYAQLSRRYGSGESAVMAIAKDRNCTVGSDDLSAVVSYCTQNNIPIIGTYGILYHAYREELITDADGANLLQSLKVKYKIPVTDFEHVINWFEHGKGRQLF